jgi:hypothetical protein
LPKLDTAPNEEVNALARPLTSEPLRIREPLRDRKSEFFLEGLDDEPTVAERDLVYATLPFKSTAIATQAKLAPRHSVFVTEVLPVLSKPEPVILEPVPVEA